MQLKVKQSVNTGFYSENVEFKIKPHDWMLVQPVTVKYNKTNIKPKFKSYMSVFLSNKLVANSKYLSFNPLLPTSVMF